MVTTSHEKYNRFRNPWDYAYLSIFAVVASL